MNYTLLLTDHEVQCLLNSIDLLLQAGVNKSSTIETLKVIYDLGIGELQKLITQI